MVTCSDDIYIYIMRSYLHHLDVTERQFLAKPRRRKGTQVCLFFSVVFNKD